MNYKEILLLSIIIIGSLIASQFSKMEGFEEGATGDGKKDKDEPDKPMQQLHEFKNKFDKDWEKLTDSMKQSVKK